MGREDDLIVDNKEKNGLKCPECQSANWARDGASATFILKSYQCNDCGAHWLMFKEDQYRKSKELNK